MPWIKEGNAEQFVSPPLPVVRGPLPEGVAETDPAAHAQRRRENQGHAIWRKRLVAEWCRLHRACPRSACRRAGNCASPVVACHDEAKEALDELFYPAFRAELNRWHASRGSDTPPAPAS